MIDSRIRWGRNGNGHHLVDRETAGYQVTLTESEPQNVKLERMPMNPADARQLQDSGGIDASDS